MSPRRLLAVFAQELRFQVTRPLFWIFLLLLALCAWGLSTGDVRIQAGDSDVGGEKSYITSEFAMAFILSILGGLFYTFFVAVAAGMSVIRDDELRVGEVLHATPLTTREYVWGKALAVLTTFLILLLAQAGAHAFFNHVVPNADAAEFRGPFAWNNYFRPALLFVGPQLVFGVGAFFWLGERSRRPILVFSVPVAAIVLWLTLLLDWSPSWLDPRINRLLMWIEPTGFRWLNEVWLKVDRGVLLYNTQTIGFDLPYVLSRLGFLLLGIIGLLLADRHFAASLRGTRVPATPAILEAPAPTAPPAVGSGRLAGLAMESRARGFLAQLGTAMRFEFANLKGQAGLYLFIPLIVLQAVQNGYLRVGAFDTPLLLTSGGYAAATMNTLALLVCLLLVFYIVESLQREDATRVAPLVHATPVPSGALLFGKALANGLVGVFVFLVTFVAGAVIMLIQGKVAIELRPFLLLWGLLVLPTFLVWSGFIMAAHAFLRNRYTTYAVGLAVIIGSGVLQVRGKMNWLINWNLWSTTTWTDFGSVEPNGAALLLNRLFYVALAGLFVAVAVRLFPRREVDPARALDRLRPRAVLVTILRLAPFWVPALVLGILLGARVQASFQGKAAENRERDYWRKNLLTWLDAPEPYLAGVEIDLELEPDEGRFRVAGHYDLFHDESDSLRAFVLSVGDHFEEIAWTLEGTAVEPEDRERLFVFTFDPPLAPGDTVRLGFSHRGQVPPGFTKNGGGISEFIQPCGIVLTSFSNSFLPTIGFDERRGEDPEHTLEARVYPPDHHVGKTRPAFGSVRPFPVRTRITGPERMDYHGVGVKVREDVVDGRRTVVWESDEPVNFFNVVGAEWAVWKGSGTELYHHPRHTYNLEEMGRALDAARRWYSAWFHPYPWAELRVNEFPGLANYAQGFPSNITFSESIGFLTRSTDEVRTAFLVTAHETAHQWWGNLVLPGEGPGGDIVSEGMAHFSTILLFDQVYGARDRIEFCKRIEENYGDNRIVDSERPLVLTDGTRPGDQTVTYDKGGWVFWMLHDLMGADSSFAGIQSFVRTYRESDDHPVLEDYVAALRPHAPDSLAFDAFVRQWFFEVVAPEFAFHDVESAAQAGGWVVTGALENEGTGTVTVEVAASRGERFPDGDAEGASATGGPVPPEPSSLAGESYREARTSLRLGPGERAAFRIECDFEPEGVIADPDARVLQILRESARASL